MADQIKPKFKIGDVVKLKRKEQGTLNKSAYEFLTKRLYFTVKEIIYDDRLADQPELQIQRPYLDLGFNRRSEAIPFASYRFEIVPEDEIDKDDPYGEEIYEIGYTFSDKISKTESEAIDYIRTNIGSFWIQLDDLSNLCRVISIDENYEKR